MSTINAGDKTPQRINWHRLWEPVQLAGASRELSIISPVSPVIRSEHSVRYEDLDVLGCVVLLGPPGSGKSTELEAACREAEKEGRITSIVRLRSVPTIEDLKSTLQKAKTAWEDGTTNWYIFIDGLDEAPVHNREMQIWILSIFRDIVRLAGDRLELPKLRLTCRSADWPDRFEEDLSTIWGQERTGVFQLTELAIEDVRLSVESWTSDQRESFIECLNTQGLWSLAKSPVTLGMLERIFATFGGKLPSSLVATYRAALLALVEDPRRLSDVPAAAGNFAPIELLRLLGRIATVSILSGKPIIWSGLYADPVPLDAVSVTELSGGVETNLPHPVIADERAFRQALRTAVFRSDGRNRSAWVHQSFAEFLSADYLAQGVSSPERMLELLSVDEGGSRRIPAQAREVAAWLAGIHKEFRRLLIKSEPDLLLRSDVASADTEFKSDLTRELLARISSDEALDVWRDPRIKFERLNYPRISDGLRPYILDQKYNHAVRRAAIGIARDCRASDSRGDLLQVAHDATENSHMRAAAVIALGALNDEESLSQIKPLLNTSHDSDPQDEIRGAVLRTLWPRQLSEKELFEALSAPRDNHLLGWYKAFIYQLKIESLSRDGALAAIRWIRNFPLSSEVQITFRTLVANVITAVWHCASDDDVMREIVNTFTASPHNYGGVLSVVDLSDFRSEFYNSPQNLRRRLVIETAVSASDPQSAISAIMYGPWRFVVAADLPWILEDLVDEQSSIPKNTLLEIVILLIHGREVEDVSCVWDYAAKYPPLAEALTSLFTTHLDSPTAMWAKQDHERRVKTARQESQTPARSEQLARLLDLCDSDPSQWWRVNFALLDSDKPTGDELTGNLSKSPGWNATDNEQQQHLVRAAFRYITEYSLSDLSWVGSNTILRSATAGYRALRLLHGHAQPLLNTVPQEAWGRWVGAILWFPNNDDEAERAIRAEIACMARAQAPAQFIEALELVLSRANSPFDVVEVVDQCFDDEIGELLWHAVQSYSIHPLAKERLIEFLIRRRFGASLAWVKNFLSGPIFGASELSTDATLVSYGAAIWFMTFPREAWSLLWSRHSIDPEQTHTIWLRIASNSFVNWSFLSELTADQLRELYLWLYKRYPESQHQPASGYLGPEDQLRMFRGNVLATLTRLGSDEAISGLTQLRDELPDDPWLPAQLHTAKEARRSANWRRLEPNEVLRKLGIAVPTQASRAQSIIAAAAIESAVVSSALVDEQRNAFTASETVLLTPVPIQRPTLKFLLVATEWWSSHGGLSTLNRDLATALAANGHDVTCLIPQITPQEEAAASASKVRLVGAPVSTGYSGVELIDVCTKAPIGNVPDYIIGHDHVTGRSALRIKNEFFPSSLYVHVLHTIPRESEQYKGDPDIGTAAMRGHQKGTRQEELCRCADAVIAIGPRVADHFLTRVSDCSERILEFMPGLNPKCLAQSVLSPNGRGIEVLWIGRAKEPELKGLDIVMHIAALMQNKRFETRSPRFAIRGIEEHAKSVKSLMDKVEVNRKLFDWRPFSHQEADILNDLRSASCLLMPSRTEAFGLVGLEAIALGIPVLISSDSGLGTFLLRQGSRLWANKSASGFVLDVNDDAQMTARAWVNALEACLENRPASFATGTALRNDLVTAASWEVALADLERHLKKIGELGASKISTC